MQTYDDDGGDGEEVCEVKEVEVLSTNDGKASEEHGSHDCGGNNAGEDQRGTPDSEGRGVAGPYFAIEVRWVENLNVPSIRLTT